MQQPPAGACAPSRNCTTPSWTSEASIADLGDSDANHYNKPNLIPRVRAWIDQYYPGTKLAITEYNWGGDDTNSGAVAQAELLAIFAREGVDLAARWVAPAAASKNENASACSLITTTPVAKWPATAWRQRAPTSTRSVLTAFASLANATWCY